jgi:hypothetical protein
MTMTMNMTMIMTGKIRYNAPPLDRFLPYEAKAEICQKIGWLLGRFEDTKISF